MPSFDELCSAELLNHKFMIPCDPVNYLDKEYGSSRWQIPKSSILKLKIKKLTQFFQKIHI